MIDPNGTFMLVMALLSIVGLFGLLAYLLFRRPDA
jgi:hypothetical protein